MPKLQKTLDGKETWHGICMESCWFAKGKRCRCRCEGAGHGRGLERKKTNKKPITKKPREKKKEGKIRKCRCEGAGHGRGLKKKEKEANHEKNRKRNG